MNDERGPGAMPKLYGAPAYARPPAVAVNPVERPFDPDDLPLEAERAEEDLEQAARLQARSYESGVMTVPQSASSGGNDSSGKLRARPFRLRLPGRG